MDRAKATTEWRREKIFLLALCFVLGFAGDACPATSVVVPIPPPRPPGLQSPEPHPPEPHPPELPQPVPRPPEPRPPELGPPARAPVPAPALAPDDSCARVMASGRFVAETVAPLSGIGGCGIAAPLKLEAVILADGRRVQLEPELVLRCDFAAAFADWVREDVAPAVEAVGGGLVKILGAGGYECRSRNRVEGAITSEHGKGNALDLSGFGLADGRALLIERPADALEWLTPIHDSACARFSTVLGPGADGFHAAHLHVDLEARRNNAHLCEWDLE